MTKTASNRKTQGPLYWVRYRAKKSALEAWYESTQGGERIRRVERMRKPALQAALAGQGIKQGKGWNTRTSKANLVEVLLSTFYPFLPNYDLPFDNWHEYGVLE